uniref:Uncharacterized protein n=1 Tax=Laticauda laticaudata TaxID=8630 RepID=A0A8C5RC74_LATLA
METLEEFDSEYPLVLSFCERISPQDYEGQSLSYTQKSLQELFTQMERKPSICERVVRKRKQAENERGSLGQYLKAKFFALLQGDVNYDNSLGEMEMEEKVEQLKREMEKANDYARGNSAFPFLSFVVPAFGVQVFSCSLLPSPGHFELLQDRREPNCAFRKKSTFGTAMTWITGNLHRHLEFHLLRHTGPGGDKL